MTLDEGTKQLIFHAQPEVGSFLGMLRPYRGLRTAILDDVLKALRASAPGIRVENPSRDLVSALWSISHLGRSWALDADGMLRRNKLVSREDQSRIAVFLERFDYAVRTLLEGGSDDEAFADPGTHD